MKSMKLKNILFAALVLLACSVAGFAQSPTSTQQFKTRLDSARFASTSVTSAQTVTLNPANSGEIVVIYGMNISNCAGASAVTAAAPTSITTTGFATGSGTNNASLAFQVGSGVTAGLCVNEPVQIPDGGLYASSSGAVTFVMPTFATNQTIRLVVFWGSSPAPTF